MVSTWERTLIVMPAYNESQSVGDVVRETLEALPGISILVVNDGSSDNTAEVAAAAGARVAHLPFNLGVGGAMRVGFRYAVERGYHVVVQIDSDGQHDPRAVPSLLAQLDTHDVVLGARFAGEGDYVMRGPRRWAANVLAWAISRTAKTRLTDTTSGFRASGPRAVALFEREYPAEYLGDTIESLVIACRAGLRVTQVPVTMRERAGGVPSHRPIKAAFYLARATLALVFAYIRPAVTIPVTTAPGIEEMAV